MAKDVKTIIELQRLCFEALKGHSGFDGMKSVEVRPRPFVEGGANWTFAVHPRAAATHLRSAREVIMSLQQNFELASD